MTVNIKDIFKKKNEEESIDFEAIFKHLISQRKIGLFLLLVSFLTIFIPQVIKKRSETLFKGGFEILIKDPISSSSPTLSATASLAGLTSIGQKSDNWPTLINYLKSEVVLSELAAKYGYTPKEISSLINIEMGGPRGKAEGILKIEFTTDDYLIGDKILTELSKSFINASSKYKQERLISGLEFINKEKPNLEKKIALLQKEFNKYEQKYRIVKDKDDLIVNIIKKDSFLNEKISKLEKDDAPNNEREFKQINKKILEIENEFKDPSAILNKLNKIQFEIKKYSDGIVRFRTLSENYRLDIAQNSIPWRIISKPFMNQSPIKIDYLKLFIMSFIGSNFFSLSIILIYIRYKNVFIDEEDIKNFINLQCLGILPKFKINEISEIQNINDLNNFLEDKKSKLIIYQKSIEDYCIGIKNLNEKKNFKSFFLASPISNEIKTLVNVISSQILSNTDARVILIDTNFETPILEKFFNLNSSIGLIDYLSNKKIQTSEIINKSNFNNYLDIICAGKVPREKYMLLGSSRMRELIDYLKNDYQYIFINGSSINNSPQSAINGNLSDLTTLLISTKHLKKSDLVKSVEKLTKAGSNIDAILIENQF